MGPHVAALLLFGVIVNMAECDYDHDSCHRGVTVFETFVNRPCGVDNDPLATLLQSPELTAGPLTADKVRIVVTQFCRTVMPAVRRCFAERVSHCEARQQTYLNSVANGTGFLCTPGSSEVQPWVITVLSRLTDSGLKENKSCSEKRAIHNFCLQRAARASSQSASMYRNAMNRLPVREFVPLVRSFFTTLFGCLVRKHHRDPFRCSGWRWHAFNAFLDFRHMGVTPLGFHVALTPDQARFMFAVKHFDTEKWSIQFKYTTHKVSCDSQQPRNPMEHLLPVHGTSRQFRFTTLQSNGTPTTCPPEVTSAVIYNVAVNWTTYLLCTSQNVIYGSQPCGLMEHHYFISDCP